MAAGDRIILKKEGLNQHDPFAVLAFTMEGKWIGRVERSQSKNVCLTIFQSGYRKLLASDVSNTHAEILIVDNVDSCAQLLDTSDSEDEHS